MSRSNPRVTNANPCKTFLKWKGAEGHFTFWNKETEKEEVYPLGRFLFLDKLFTIKGYSDKHGQSIYSNEIHDLKKEVLNVRVFKTDSVSVIGTYSEIIEKMPSGAKIATSLYALDCNTGEMINLQLTGSSLSAWIEFQKENKTWQSGAIEFKGKSDQKKKGATKYYEPVFSLGYASPEEDKQAIELDKQLQEYLSGYKTAEPVEAEAVEVLQPALQPNDNFDDLDDLGI